MSIFQQLDEQKSERFCVKPAIVIGLGGTGTEICLRLKSLINEKAGPDFPLVKFLIFDTDVMDVSSVAAGESSPSSPNSVKSLFTPNEYYHLVVRDVAGIVKNAEKHNHIFSWFPRDLEIGDVLNGANQVRLIGRLALYWNVSQVVDAINRVKKEVSSIKNKALATEKGFDLQEGLAVYILTSLCGGSGSGMFLDMGYLVRDLVDSAEVNACCVMPSAFQIEQQGSIEANAYAALKELDHLMTAAEFRMNLGPQTEPKTFKVRPFDNCYLLDSWTESAMHIEGHQSVCEIISRVVFNDCMTSAGRKHRSVTDNLKFKSANRICERLAAYSSFGLSSIYFDDARVRNSCAATLAEEFAGKFIRQCEKKDVKNRVIEFIRLNHLNEEVTDDVITFMRTIGRAPLKYFKNPADFDQYSMDLMLPEIQKWYSELKNIELPDRFKAMEQNLEALSAKVVAALDREMDAILSERGLGINFAEQYLSSMEIVFRSYAEMLAAEAQKLREQKKQILIMLKINKITELMNSFWSYLVYKSKILESRDDLLSEMTREINTDIEIYIRELAIAFYRKACEKIGEINRGRVAQLRDFISSCEKNFEKMACEWLNPRTMSSAFTEKKVKYSHEDVKRIYEKYCPKNIEEVINKFLGTVTGPVNLWDLSKKEEIAEKIFRHCASFFEELDRISILALLKEDGTIADVIEDLMRSASPMWSYSTVEMPSGTQADEVSIISSTEENRVEFVKYLREQSKAVFTPTNSNHRISVMRFRHGLPLFALTCLKRDLKQSYEMFRNGSSVNTPKKPLHISSAYESLPEITIE